MATSTRCPCYGRRMVRLNRHSSHEQHSAVSCSLWRLHSFWAAVDQSINIDSLTVLVRMLRLILTVVVCLPADCVCLDANNKTCLLIDSWPIAAIVCNKTTAAAVLVRIFCVFRRSISSVAYNRFLHSSSSSSCQLKTACICSAQHNLISTSCETNLLLSNSLEKLS